MAGPADDYDSPFYAYTRGSGLTGKTDGLGSFGIGKKAPVVNSGMRTIFVSTRFNDERYGPSNLCQGMSFWVTHQDDELLYDGTGFWGVRDGNPVTEDVDLPSWLVRKELGKTGRSWAVDEVGFTGEDMGIKAMNAIDKLFNTWTPRERYELINVNDVKEDTIKHKFVY